MISVYFNYKGQTSAAVLCFHVIVATPDYGRNYRPKHTVVNVINK